MSPIGWRDLKVRALAVKTAALRSCVTAVLDVLLFITIVIALSMPVTGPAVHEWLGLFAAVLLLIHIVRRWPWFEFTLQRPGHHGVRTLAALALNASLLIDVVLVVFSGALISHDVLPAIGLATNANFAWRGVHSSFEHLLMLLVGLHLALNWHRVCTLFDLLVSLTHFAISRRRQITTQSWHQGPHP
jgi:hypothetical protein